jgi:hypothetical protein
MPAGPAILRSKGRPPATRRYEDLSERQRRLFSTPSVWAAKVLGVGRNVALRWARELGVHRPPRTLIPEDANLEGNGAEVARRLGVTKSAVYHARQRQRNAAQRARRCA